MTDPAFANEAEMVAAFVAHVDRLNPRLTDPWTAYAETAGWDLLMVQPATGIQVGIEAKMALNLKVLSQALPDHWYSSSGPDYRAVLVPRVGKQLFLADLMRHIGVTVITADRHAGWSHRDSFEFQPSLPDEATRYSMMPWHPWLPEARCTVPDYVPDVTGGKPCPVALTPWKVKAIKLLILLDRRGFVTRADMRALDISATRWTDVWHGFLTADPIIGGYVRCRRTPDLRAQHPVNYEEIEADFEKWAPPGRDFTRSAASVPPANDSASKDQAA